MDDTKTITPWHRQPIWLGLIGLGLTVGGAMLTTYNPLSPRQADQAGKLAELRNLAEGEHAQRLDHYARNVRPKPPYRVPGRLLFGAGACLFVLAAVLMFRQPPGPPAPPEERAEGPPAGEGEDDWPESGPPLPPSGRPI